MKLKLINLFAVLIVVGVIVGLFATGKLVWANSSGNNATNTACGTDIVNKYNDAMNYIGRNGSDASNPSIDTAGVAAVKKQVMATSGYKNDATCQTLLFWIAINDRDYPTAKSSYATVNQLHDKGVFADNNIRSNNALLSYQSLLDGINPDIKGPR